MRYHLIHLYAGGEIFLHEAATLAEALEWIAEWYEDGGPAFGGDITIRAIPSWKVSPRFTLN